jgi:hypothetical protein
MLDSLLTLTKAGAAWMAGIFGVALLADVAISAVTRTQEPIFLLLAVMTLVAFVLRAVYTLGKWAWHRLRGDGPAVPPPED